MKKYIKYLLILFIIALIVTMATMPNVHSHGYWLVKTHVDIMALETAVEIFILDNKRIPNISEGLDILVDLPKNVNLPNWKGYLPSVRKDHWGSKYIYHDQKSNKKLFQIYSSGPDGVDNAGMGDDVVLWDKDYNCALYNDCYTLKDHINRISTIITLIAFVLLFFGLISYIAIILIRKAKDNKPGGDDGKKLADFS